MRLFLTSPRCCCKRRLNILRRKSLSSRVTSPMLYSSTCFRRSLSFGTFRLPSCNKAGRDGQFMAGQADGFFGDLFGDATNFKDNAPRLDNGYPVVHGSLTATHAGLGGFGANRLIGEDTDPHFATALHEACECDTCSLDLPGLHPARFHCLQPKLAKGEGVAPLGSSFHTTAMLSAVLCT